MTIIFKASEKITVKVAFMKILILKILFVILFRDHAVTIPKGRTQKPELMNIQFSGILGHNLENSQI